MWWKCGEIQISDPRVFGKKIVWPESIIVITLSSLMLAMGLAVRHSGDQ